MAASLKPLDLGPFTPGVNNRRPEFKMAGGPDDGGDFLRFAVNTDLSDDGVLKRRAGYAQALAGADCHSLWSSQGDTIMVDGASLKRITGLPDAASASPLVSGLATGRPMSYARTPYAVYYSNGVQFGRITSGGVRPACTPALASPPRVAVGAGGLQAGRYGVCFTHLDASGEESASTAPVWADVGPQASLQISGLPAAFPSGATALAIYVTACNDSVLQRFAVLRQAQTTYAIPVLPAQPGARCQTVLLQPLPAGDIVRFQSGRLLSAKAGLLCYSEPYMLGLFNPTKGYIQFPADITLVEPTAMGTWVCADQTYWFAGNDIAAANPDSKLPYGAVPGSSGAVPNTNDVFWMSPRGLVLGTHDGQARNLQEARVAVSSAGFAAGFVRESDGRRQLIESTFAAEPNRMAAASYMDAEVSRKEVTL